MPDRLYRTKTKEFNRLTTSHFEPTLCLLEYFVSIDPIRYHFTPFHFVMADVKCDVCMQQSALSGQRAGRRQKNKGSLHS